MALGAVTLQGIDPSGAVGVPMMGVGPYKVAVANVVGDSAYGAGGSTLTAAALGLNRILFAHTQIITPAANVAYVAALVQADGSVKLKSFAGAGTTPNIGLAEETATANQSGMTVQVVAFGY